MALPPFICIFRKKFFFILKTWGGVGVRDQELKGRVYVCLYAYPTAKSIFLSPAVKKLVQAASCEPLLDIEQISKYSFVTKSLLGNTKCT